MNALDLVKTETDHFDQVVFDFAFLTRVVDRIGKKAAQAESAIEAADQRGTAIGRLVTGVECGGHSRLENIFDQNALDEIILFGGLERRISI